MAGRNFGPEAGGTIPLPDDKVSSIRLSSCPRQVTGQNSRLCKSAAGLPASARYESRLNDSLTKHLLINFSDALPRGACRQRLPRIYGRPGRAAYRRRTISGGNGNGCAQHRIGPDRTRRPAAIGQRDTRRTRLILHQAFHLRFTATPSSWTNRLEPFLRETAAHFRKAGFSSIREPSSVITTFRPRTQYDGPGSHDYGPRTSYFRDSTLRN